MAIILFVLLKKIFFRVLLDLMYRSDWTRWKGYSNMKLKRKRERRDLWELWEDRVRKRRTLNKWKRQKNEPTRAPHFFSASSTSASRKSWSSSRLLDHESRTSSLDTAIFWQRVRKGIPTTAGDRIDLKMRTNERKRGRGERKRNKVRDFAKREEGIAREAKRDLFRAY